jgi:hypothetical protein
MLFLKSLSEGNLTFLEWRLLTARVCFRREKKEYIGVADFSWTELRNRLINPESSEAEAEPGTWSGLKQLT